MNIDINFKVTESALNEIKKVMKESSLEGQYVRVSIKGGGCSGFMYGLGFEEEIDEANDIVEDFNGVKVAIDKKSALFLNDVTLDWQDELSQRGFKFKNPNANKTCGCGKSFQ